MLIFLIAILIVIYTFQSFFCNLFSKHYKGDPDASSLVFTVLYGLVVGLLSLIKKGFAFSPSPQTWLWGVICAVSVFLYNLSLVHATQKGPYSIATISLLFGGLLGPIGLSSLVLHQPISLPAIIGLVVMMIAFIALNATKVEFRSTPLAFYIWCALLFLANGAFCIFLALHSIRVSEMERPEMLVITYLGSALLACILLCISRSRKIFSDFAKIGKRSWMYGTICWICATAGVTLSQYTLGKVKNLSIFYAAQNGGVLVFSVLLSVIVLKERPSRIQMLGMALAVGSIVLLSL